MIAPLAQPGEIHISSRHRDVLSDFNLKAVIEIDDNGEELSSV